MKLIAAMTLVFAIGQSCGPKAGKMPTNVGPTIAAKPNMYLRSSFDTDPSSYLGRFVPAGTTSLDETSAMQLTCSKHITYKKVGGGGVMYDEVYQASAGAAASFGIPLVASASAGAEAGTNVRVKYTLISKMVADIADPAAFETCCKAAGDQCTDLFLGEFLEGTGELFYATASGSGGKGSGALPSGVGLDIEMKNGVAWAKSITFPNPVYFAFKTTQNQYTGKAVAGCGDWVNAPPRSTQGVYFVGLSQPMQSEASARDMALKNSRVQTVQWAGQSIAEGTLEANVDEGVVNEIQSAIRQETVIEAASQGVAKHVKDESWCVTTQGSPGGTLYVAKVLAFVPNDATKDIAQVVVKVVAGEKAE